MYLSKYISKWFQIWSCTLLFSNAIWWLGVLLRWRQIECPDRGALLCWRQIECPDRGCAVALASNRVFPTTLTISSNIVCPCKKLFFSFFQSDLIFYHIAGLVLYLKFSKLPNIAQEIGKSYAKIAVPYRNTCKSNFLWLDSRFSLEWKIFMGKNTLSGFQKLGMLGSKLFRQMG